MNILYSLYIHYEHEISKQEMSLKKGASVVRPSQDTTTEKHTSHLLEFLFVFSSNAAHHFLFALVLLTLFR